MSTADRQTQDRDNPRIVPVILCHGCFDGLHLGHIRYFDAAKKLIPGARLIVSVTTDRFVNKGQGRPYFTQEERCEALRALSCVDQVILSDAPSAVDIIANLKPDVYVKGSDYDGVVDPQLNKEIAAVESVGGKFMTTDSRMWSSTRLLRRSSLSDEARMYCLSARDRGFLDKIKTAFDRADKLQIAFVGENIEDVYCRVRPLAKTSKEHLIATCDTGESSYYAGGIRAASKHAEWLSSHIVDTDSDCHSVIKTRYVDEVTSRKLFEVYSSQLIEMSDKHRKYYRERLREATLTSDVVIVIDFGHGLLGREERQILENAKFLAVTAQSNAGNFGFNSVLKYTGADYVCVDETEARLSVGDQHGDIASVYGQLHVRTQATHTVITRGRHGSIPYMLHSVPALAGNVLDTIGAGDAFLAVTAPLIAAGLDAEMAAFVGNVAGAIKIGIPGHAGHVKRVDLIREVECLLQ